jgi:hypothetical protein
LYSDAFCPSAEVPKHITINQKAAHLENICFFMTPNHTTKFSPHGQGR